jgi:hypothetical protein
MDEATALKNQGNDAFKNKEWPKAIDFYSQAIEKYDKEPSFYTNRAQVRFNSAPSTRQFCPTNQTPTRLTFVSRHTDMLSPMLPRPLS